ncbi:NUDIX hydrolase [Desulfosoma caldarium]|uniref:GDP-mannose pyrophosphatase n=1 Tax=Desulfosoma caldarium TaxID=610254 RepID=A0A3N1ULA7_9BACT|nr:NUDIX hydrolase [Desulfosoma caldarium]ROQ90189.1 ADP-ribose pyrophosphatase [Desulfosoma caldarium]
MEPRAVEPLEAMEERLRTLASLHANHFSAHLDAVRLRTGRMTERIRMEHPEAAAVLAFTDPECTQILMVRQWRYAIGRETLEIPAGKLDPGESAEDGARRELLEETGYRASVLVPIFRYHPAIGYSDEVIAIFAASGLRREKALGDEDEISRVEILSVDQVMHSLHEGTITDGKTVIALCLYQSLKARGALTLFHGAP